VTLPVLGALPLAAAATGNGATAAPRPEAFPKRGEPAPDFSLPDLSGYTIHLSDFRGSTTLVLFWRPSCGFCQRMLNDLQAWEAHPPADAPKLLVVSTESVADNQAMGLRSPVLLDQDGMRVGGRFDAEGKMASELAEVGRGFVQKELRAHVCSQIDFMKPFKKCHTSGFPVSFMHVSRQIVLLLSQHWLACEGDLWAYERFLHESSSYLYNGLLRHYIQSLSSQSHTPANRPPSTLGNAWVEEHALRLR